MVLCKWWSKLRQRELSWFASSSEFICKNINCKTWQIKFSPSKWDISTAAQNFFLSSYSVIYFLGCHNHSSSRSNLFLSSGVYLSQPASVPHVIDACVWWHPTAKYLHQKVRVLFTDRLYFSSCRHFACTSSPSLSRMPASVIPASSLFSGDGSVNNILSCQWTMLRTQHQAYYFLKLILILLCYRRLFLVSWVPARSAASNLVHTVKTTIWKTPALQTFISVFLSCFANGKSNSQRIMLLRPAVCSSISFFTPFEVVRPRRLLKSSMFLYFLWKEENGCPVPVHQTPEEQNDILKAHIYSLSYIWRW